jgi:hypothetical protein
MHAPRRLPVTPSEIDAAMTAARAERARVAAAIAAAAIAGVRTLFTRPEAAERPVAVTRPTRA